MEPPIKVTPLRISTMTVTGDLGAIPNLQRLFDHSRIIPYWQIGEGIIKIEFAGEKKGQCMEDILHVSSKEKKRFFNQSSLVFRLKRTGTLLAAVTDLPEDPLSPYFKEVNIKLFKNGGFQMTGINSEELGRAALHRLISQYRDIWEPDADVHIKKFNPCLINSDYEVVGKAIHRDNLYHILVEEYGIWSTYEPTRYQGVNSKFFWNKMRHKDAPPGVCLCPIPCSGEGDGYSIGNCKKITIAPFRTGKIIITGARHLEQLYDTYEFVNQLLTKHADDVLRDPIMDPIEVTGRKKKTPKILTTPEALVRHRMRTSPRNIVHLRLSGT